MEKIKIDIKTAELLIGDNIIDIPKSLDDLTVGHIMQMNVIIKDEKLSDYEKSVEITSIFAGVSREYLDSLNIDEYSKVSNAVLPLISGVNNFDEKKYNPDDYTILTLHGVDYALEPDLSNMETGAFIEFITLAEDVENNLHSMMAILYRPLDKVKGNLYSIAKYTSESDLDKQSREALFYEEMPYSVVRSVVNFILRQAVF